MGQLLTVTVLCLDALRRSINQMSLFQHQLLETHVCVHELTGRCS